MNSTMTFDEKYNVILSKSPGYDGVFIVAVKTTGIFCRPVCSARNPKAENVQFFNTVEEAQKNGFRACKKCKPLEKINETPERIKKVLDDLEEDSGLWIKDGDLIKKNLEPTQVRRWFKKNYGMTFHRYQRAFRINKAFHQMQSGESVKEAAYAAGFESVSSFADNFRSIFGNAPANSKDAAVITMMRINTPIGIMIAGATKEGICLLEFTNRIRIEKEFSDLRKRLNAVMLPGRNAHLEQLEKEMAGYFEGKRRNFTVPLYYPGTSFEQSVWKSLQEIPYGETCTYKEQSERMNNPKAIRAIASTNGRNRMAIIIPCHRVIGSNGSLVGYAAGVEKKRWLLNFEKNNSPYGDGCLF